MNQTIPLIYYVAMIALAVAVIALLLVRVFDVSPRRYLRSRTRTRRIWDALESLDNRLLNLETENRERFGDPGDQVSTLNKVDRDREVNYNGTSGMFSTYQCSECSHVYRLEVLVPKMYCPNCGTHFNKFEDVSV